MKKIIGPLLLVCLLCGCVAPAAIPDIVETPVPVLSVSPEPTLATTPDSTPANPPAPSPEPTPSPTPLAYTPTLTEDEWAECFDRAEYVVSIEAVKSVDISFLDNKETIVAFVTFRDKASDINDQGISLMVSGIITAINSIAAEYDETIKPIDIADDYYGGVAERYGITIDFTDNQLKAITTMYLQAGSNNPIFM